MSDRLSRWAKIAEIISGAMVVLSLIFLNFEIRSNTQVLQRSAYDNIIETLLTWRRDMYTNAALISAFDKRADGIELSQSESRMMSNMGISLYQNYERAYWANEYGHMGESEWNRFHTAMCQGIRMWWPDGNEYLFTVEFVRFVKSCDEFQ